MVHAGTSAVEVNVVVEELGALRKARFIPRVLRPSLARSRNEDLSERIQTQSEASDRENTLSKASWPVPLSAYLQIAVVLSPNRK